MLTSLVIFRQKQGHFSARQIPTPTPRVVLSSFLVGGSNPTITLNNGETLVAGFHQMGNPGMVSWEAGDPDDLRNLGVGGNTIPAGGTGALVANANWATLGRDYRFKVGLDVVPEPSIPFLLLFPASFAAMISRRRRTF